MKYPKYPKLFQSSTTHFMTEEGPSKPVSSFKAMLQPYGTALELVWGHQDEDEMDAKGYVSECGFNSYLIVIQNKEDATLVHELEHLVHAMSDTLGIERGKNTEAQAYLMGYLFTEIKKVV